jgi:2-isopropylmalate synthase
MPFRRYARSAERVPPGATSERLWPDLSVDRAPLWASVDLRDGNQSLISPMGLERKRAMFDLLLRMGFKDIEVGYPSASASDFSFVRRLVAEDAIPDDVTISVFTPARPELIERTFEAIAGVDRAMVHLCHATACLWREVVFGMTMAEVEQMALQSAEQVLRHADAMPAAQLRFEYSPETFNVTEPEFALSISNLVCQVWDASPDRPVTLNLPTTVETDSPTVFADQIEWMHRNLERRRSIILSVHPHNDRGTAVASAELALQAGADRVEGTLFGNGERTGNVCLATLALNLFSRGLDPQLDFSDIDEVRRSVEFCNQLPVSARHPYVGDLVYTAFSGTHQDAIAKGLAAVQARADQAGTTTTEQPWEVPYLPIDPHDVGRSYESVVRVNSQSGKGGIAHVLKASHGLELPRWLKVEFAQQVQHIADRDDAELDPAQLWDALTEEYLRFTAPSVLLKEFHFEGEVLDGILVRVDGSQVPIRGVGVNSAQAVADALRQDGLDLQLLELEYHTAHAPFGTGQARQGIRSFAYAQVRLDGQVHCGVGVDDDELAALCGAVVSAVNRGRR